MNSELKNRIIHKKNGTIPDGFVYLNYSNFPSDWRELSFKEAFEFNGSMSASRNDLSDDGIAYLHYGDIHKSQKTYIDFDSEYMSLPKLNIPIEKIKTSSLLENGDIVFADASEDYECIGKSIVVYKKSNDRFISGLHTIIARSKQNILDNGFKRYFISEWSIRKQIMRFATGISVYGISKSNLEKVKMCIPKLNEQIKIADILSTWDKAIELKEKLIEEKKKQKTGLMQRLLTGKVRLPGFDGEWEEITLDLITKYKASNISISSLKIDTNQNKRAYCIYNANGIFNKVDFYEMDKEYISIVKDGAGAGRLRKCEKYSSIIGTMGYIIPNDKVAYEFLYQRMLIVDFSKYLKGSTIPHVYYKDYKNEKLQLPSLKEQKAIAEVLNTADKEIDLLEKELEALKLQKKGLMQLLLTGIVRVNKEQS